MTLKEYVQRGNKFKSIVRQRIKDPITVVMEQDDLPYDAIMPVEGIIQKVVYISDDMFVPVIELISYYKKEVENMKDENFKNAYFAYMDNVEVEDVDLESIINMSREYLEKKEQKEGLLRNVRDSTSNA